MKIKKIAIIGLFEAEDVLFDLSQSPIFLVGPNGVGKTTSLKLLFYLLTAQWNRFRPIPFIGFEFVSDEGSFFIERDDFKNIGAIRTSLGLISRRSRANQVWPEKWDQASKVMSTRPAYSRISPQRREEIQRLYEPLAAINNFVERETKTKVLYFPTYRRVERDLSELIGNVDDEEEGLQAAHLAETVQERFREFGEVIGFGGQDIRRLVTDAAERIEQQARKALNEHSIRFLEALASESAVDTKAVRKFIKNSENVAQLLSRIDSFAVEGFNADSVRERLEGLSEKLQGQSWGRLKQQDDMLLYYVSELRDLFATVDLLSAPLRKFHEVIERYLAPIKRTVFDQSDNTISIYDRYDNEIDFDDLSSGEKQILAFFAFLVLGEKSGDIYIILDEPELSLSVSWQKSLVSDIVSTSACRYIAVATHSPFIIDQFPLDRVVSLEGGL